MTNKYDALRDHLLKDVEMLKIEDKFGVRSQRIANEKSMFTYNNELYETETGSHGMIQCIPHVLLVPVMF